MKIYPQHWMDMDSMTGKIGIVLIIAAALTLAWLAFQLPASNPITLALDKNPLSLSGNDSTLLHVQLINPSPETVNNILVQVETPGTEALSIYPKSQSIERLGPNETRKLQFLVLPLNPVSNPFLAGTYTIRAHTKLGEKEYTQSIVLNVEK